MHVRIELPQVTVTTDMDDSELRSFLLAIGKEKVRALRKSDGELCYVALDKVIVVDVSE